ncbi:hypothetical protein ES708_18380 [subsurface metagenome]
MSYLFINNVFTTFCHQAANIVVNFYCYINIYVLF